MELLITFVGDDEHIIGKLSIDEATEVINIEVMETPLTDKLENLKREFETSGLVVLRVVELDGWTNPYPVGQPRSIRQIVDIFKDENKSVDVDYSIGRMKVRFTLPE